MAKIKITGIEIESDSDIKSVNLEIDYTEQSIKIKDSGSQSDKTPESSNKPKGNAPFQSVY